MASASRREHIPALAMRFAILSVMAVCCVAEECSDGLKSVAMWVVR